MDNPSDLAPWLQHKFLGNTLSDYLVALGLFVATYSIVRIFRRLALGRLRQWAARTTSRFDDFILERLNHDAAPLLYIAGAYAAFQHLRFAPSISRLLYVALSILITYFALRVLVAALGFVFEEMWMRKGEDAVRARRLHGIIGVIKIAVWIIGVLFLLDNLGFQVSAIITGLGIGGVAVALAAQAVLGDFFSYLAIFFDRPFEIGDFIVAGDMKGTVEAIGIKTTRIRSVEGELITVPNSDLTKSRVHNFKRLERRRMRLQFAIAYSVPIEQLRTVPGLVEQSIRQTPRTLFDRAHFIAFGDAGFLFEAAYYFLGPEFNQAVESQQAILLAIKEALDERGLYLVAPK